MQDQEIDFECLDFSIDGMRLRVAEQNNEIVKAGAEAKIVSGQLGLEALAKIVWVNRNEDDEIIYSGLRYLEINE